MTENFNFRPQPPPPSRGGKVNLLSAQKALESAQQAVKESQKKLSNIKSSGPLLGGTLPYIILSMVMVFSIVVVSNDMIAKKKTRITKILDGVSIGLSVMAILYSMYMIHKAGDRYTFIAAILIVSTIIGITVPVTIFRKQEK